MTNVEKHYAAQKAVRRHIKQINTWRKIGLSWKGINQTLGLECTHFTLAYHYHHRGLT